MSENNFTKLASIDVSKHVEKKQNLSYLSWPFAIDQLMRHDQSANWEFHKPEMYGETMMVSCTVTAFGKPMKMHLPVMDHRNQAVKNPDAFVVNKNMMRCLVKAIACHGLGLNIYAGEDLPIADCSATEKAPPQQVEAINQQQVAELVALANEAGADMPQFFEWYSKKAGAQVTSFNQLFASEYQTVKHALEAKKAKK